MKLPTAAIASLLLVSPSSVLARLVEEESSSNRSRHVKTQDIDIGKVSGNKSRVFIKYAPNKKEAVANAIGAAGGLFHYGYDTVIHQFGALNTFAASVPTAALEGLSNNPNIVHVEQDPIRTITPIIKSTTAATYGQTVPYGVDMVQARDVWDVDRDGVVDAGAPTGSNHTVCIIDTGFMTSHEDLEGVSVTGYDGDLPWNQDGHGHGTHVAGTIAAVNNHLGVVGVTPGTVNLYIVRVFDDDGWWAYSSDLIDAANRCASAGANIISMSLGGYYASETEYVAFDQLNAQGILSIAAAGNSGNSGSFYPASYPSVISVAAIKSNKVVARFSTRNAEVDIAAPGVQVLSTYSNSTSGYVSWSGTSMACPHVAAVAALVWSAKPSATNYEVRAALIATAEDLGVPGRDDSYGHGLVQGKNAIDYLLSPPSSERYTVPITNMALNLGGVRHYYVDVTAGQAVACSTNGPNGNANLYLRFGEAAVPNQTFQGNACFGTSDTSMESCSTAAVSEPTRIYAAVHAYSTFSDLSFQCTVSERYTVPITNMALSGGSIRHYSMDVATGQIVSCSIKGPNGNADLYMRTGYAAIPNSWDNDCSSTSYVSAGSCSTAIVSEPTRVYAAVRADEPFSSLTFQCTLALAQMYTIPITNLAASSGSVKHYYFDVTTGQAMTCSTNGPNGDADLYMRTGYAAITNSWSGDNDCSSTSYTSMESCFIAAVSKPTRVYAAVHAYEPFGSLTFQCTVTTPSPTSHPTRRPTTARPSTSRPSTSSPTERPNTAQPTRRPTTARPSTRPTLRHTKARPT